MIPAALQLRRRRLLRGDENEVPADIAEYEELDEGQREDVDRRIFRQVLSDNPAEVQRERDEVAGLCRLAEAKLAESRRDRPEAKFAELLRVLDSSDVIRRGR